MSGARRANWRTELLEEAATIKADMSAMERRIEIMIGAESACRIKAENALRDRIAEHHARQFDINAGYGVRLDRLDRRERRLRWTVYGMVVISALRTAWAVIYG